MRRFAFVLSIIAIVCLPKLLHADGLKLEMSAPKLRYFVDEPLIVKVSAKNIGNSEAEVWAQLLDPITSGVIFEITEPDGDSYRWRPECYAGWLQTPQQAILLLPGDSYSRTQDLTYQRDEKLRLWKTCFPVPGLYRVKAWGSSYQGSNVLNITVSRPRGNDKLAHDLITAEIARQQSLPYADKYKDMPLYVRGRVWQQNGWMCPLYERILAKYPKSLYAVYSRYYLAQGLERGTSWSSWDRDTRQVLRRAASLYREVIKDDRGTGLAVHAMRLCGRTCAKLRNFDDGVDMLESALFHPNSSMDDRMTALRWLKTAENGGEGSFHIYLRLDDLAKLLGLKLDVQTRTLNAKLVGPCVDAVFSPNSSKFTINGKETLGWFRWKGDGRYEVGLSVALELLRSRYKTQAFDYVLDSTNWVHVW